MATRLLYVITKANWGGAQRYVYDLATAAKAHGFEVAVATGGTGPLTEQLETAGIRVIALPLRQRKNFFLDVITFGSLFSLLKLLKTERPDLVHVNSAKAGGLGAFAARLAGIPRIIFTAHGWEFNAPRSTISKIGIYFFSWLTIVLSHTTICVSEAIKKDVRWLPLVSNKLRVIHNGVAPAAYLSRAEARHRLAPHLSASVWIGMISELHPTKRIEDAIRAFSLLVHEFADSALIVLGEGTERGCLEKLITELHLEKRVKLIGHVPDAPQYLRAFEVFVHSSQSEALAFAVLEAGLASLPVVATRVGGIPEIIASETHGILVPARNPEALAGALRELLRNPVAAEEMARRLHDRVRAEFSKEKMVAATLALYR